MPKQPGSTSEVQADRKGKSVVELPKSSRERLADVTPADIQPNAGSLKYERVENSEAGSGFLSEVHIYKEITTTKVNVSVKNVAIKRDKPEWKKYSALENEASILNLLREKLNDSAYNYIVRYNGKVNIEGDQGLLLEYLEGGDTGYYVCSQAEGEEREKQVAKWMRDILVALVIIHSVNIIHRDIKPTNFVRTRKKGGHVKLIDFGSAGRLEGRERTAISRGSFEYRSPEGHLSNLVNEKADLFALGLSTYEELTGKQAYYQLPGEKLRDPRLLDRIRDEEPDYDLPAFKNFSSEALAFIKRLLVKNPAKRPDAMTALQDRWFKNLGVDPIVKPGDSWWLERTEGRGERRS